MESKLYYGFSEETWNNLLFKAEDLLRDNELGTHLVGIYPYKPREEDFRSNQPHLMCIYIDSVETLLNPCISDPFPHELYVPDGVICMIELYIWVKYISGCKKQVKKFPWILAPFGNIIYEDESISPIVNLGEEYFNGGPDDSNKPNQSIGELTAKLYRSLA